MVQGPMLLGEHNACRVAPPAAGPFGGAGRTVDASAQASREADLSARLQARLGFMGTMMPGETLYLKPHSPASIRYETIFEAELSTWL